MRDVTLDWDWPWEDFRPEENRLIKKIKEDPHVMLIKVRRSANGKIHVWIRLDRDVDFWESIYLRSVWDDDANRIRMDIIRYWEGGETGRLWDAKIDCEREKCEIKRAGEWITIYQRDVSSSSAV